MVSGEKRRENRGRKGERGKDNGETRREGGKRESVRGSPMMD